MAGALEMDSEAWVEVPPEHHKRSRQLCESAAAAPEAGGFNSGPPKAKQARRAVGVNASRQARCAADFAASSDSAAAAAWLPPGPTNLEDALLSLRNVAERVAARAAAADVDLARADANTLGQIIWLTSSYSGMGCAEAAACAACRHLADRGVNVNVRAHSATDYAPLCRQVLRNHNAHSAPAHIMANILD